MASCWGRAKLQGSRARRWRYRGWCGQGGRSTLHRFVERHWLRQAAVAGRSSQGGCPHRHLDWHSRRRNLRQGSLSCGQRYQPRSGYFGAHASMASCCGRRGQRVHAPRWYGRCRAKHERPRTQAHYADRCAREGGGECGCCRVERFSLIGQGAGGQWGSMQTWRWSLQKRHSGCRRGRAASNLDGDDRGGVSDGGRYGAGHLDGGSHGDAGRGRRTAGRVRVRTMDRVAERQRGRRCLQRGVAGTAASAAVSEAARR